MATTTAMTATTTAMTASSSNVSVDRQESRDRLLLAALPHITFDGWTDKAFQAGIADCGMAASDFRRFFPGGACDAIDHFSGWADRRMVAALAYHAIDELSVRNRVALAVRLRLEALAPYREIVRRTLGLLALPPNLALGARCLYRTVDSLWHAIGDRSPDFNFYTKRALLAAVLSTTTLYWLDDTTDNCEGSWAFLDRRVVDVMKIPKLTQRLGRAVARLPDPLRILRAVRDRWPA
ncbi:MAG: COQ9 family protein [Proteobacteria bacterium]|nr:COQ9 family protein [Pseudomonadota bacterium]MDA1324392.1 COQ9 family protein [Pseudomonadota bacterium]